MIDKKLNFLSLIIMYNEPHRHYHNLSHIARMYDSAKEYKIELSDEQSLAILFHDVYYETDKKKLIFNGKYISNEELSADMACCWCEYNHYGQEFARKVYQIVRDTEKHIPNIPESNDVLDLDLLGLAFPETYKIQGDKIRLEYSHFTDDEFNKGRAEWLKSMLEKEFIFTGFFANGDYEVNARENLLEDLKECER